MSILQISMLGMIGTTELVLVAVVFLVFLIIPLFFFKTILQLLKKFLEKK